MALLATSPKLLDDAFWRGANLDLFVAVRDEAKRRQLVALKQQVVLPETPKERRELAALEEDLRSLPGRGRRTRLRLRNFRPSADAYLASTNGPLPGTRSSDST